MKSISLRSAASRRTLFAALTALCLSLPLVGCAAPLRERREVEQLRLIQTMGVDSAPGGIELTLASAADRKNGDPPSCLGGKGRSIGAALERIRASSVEEVLFAGHTRVLLLGQEAAVGGLEETLVSVCRSEDLRLDMPLYVVRGGTAETLMREAGSGPRGVTEVLQAVQVREERASRTRRSTAARLFRQLEQGGALLTAIALEPAAEEGGMTAAPAGYGVFKGDRLAAWIEEADAPAADLLSDAGAGFSELDVHDLSGRPVTLELLGGETKLRPVWAEDGSLRALDVLASVRAAVLEAPADGTVGLALRDDYLTGRLEAAVSERIRRVLQLEKQLGVDFLGLGRRLALVSPARWHAMPQPLAEQLAGLEISISVRGELLHSYDEKDP